MGRIAEGTKDVPSNGAVPPQGVIPNLNVTLSCRPARSRSHLQHLRYDSPTRGNPLVLIDGVETHSRSHRSSNDIESITVLKDASFGCRACVSLRKNDPDHDQER